jgi:transcriptional regulator with XRE-family HTH domain
MKEERDPGPLGTRLAALRQQFGYSLYELERRSGINRPKLMRMESGEIRQPTPETLNKLAVALDVDPEELYDLASATGPLPSLPTYFRSKYGLTDKQIQTLERTVDRMTESTLAPKPTPKRSSTAPRTPRPTKGGTP